MKLLITTFLIIVSTSLAAGAQAPDNPGENPLAGERDLYAQMDSDTARPPLDKDAPPPGPPGMRGKHKFGPEHRAFERFRIKKMLELLELDEDQQEKFMEVAIKHRSNKQQHIHAYMMTLDTLRSGLRRSKLSEDEVVRLIDKMDMLEEQKLEISRQFHDQLRPILTPEQFGKLLVFEIRFEAIALRDLHELRGGKKRHHDEARKMFRKAMEMNEDSI